MMSKSRVSKSRYCSDSYEDASELRRGPWTLEEDNLLIHYITCHGEGRWNSLARCAGLKRTGKSCRLRWLNYLKPDIKRGNLTPHEQILILELHSELGNRWSKIAQHLPGRTDNEIKNYWRTRVQKQARQLKVDSNSKKFLEAIRRFWMPRLLEKIKQNSSETSSSSSSISTQEAQTSTAAAPEPPFLSTPPKPMINNSDPGKYSSEDLTDGKIGSEEYSLKEDCYHVDILGYDMPELVSQDISFSECHVAEIDWFGEDLGSTFWNTDELWQFRKLGV